MPLLLTDPSSYQNLDAQLNTLLLPFPPPPLTTRITDRMQVYGLDWFLRLSYTVWEFNLSTPVFLKFLQLCFQFLKGKCQSHASLKITFPISIKVTGLAIPRGLYVYAEDKRLSTSHFIASFESLKKVTAKLSSALSQWSPSRFALLGLNSIASAVNCLSASNSSILENLLLKN